MTSFTKTYDEAKNAKQISLVQAYQAGDTEAIGAVMQDYEPLLRRLSFDSFTGKPDMDTYQDMALYFLETAKTYDPEKFPFFGAYMKKVLTWRKIDGQRKDIAYRKAECFDTDHSPEPCGGEIALPLGREEYASIEREVLGVLSAKQRPLFAAMVEGRSGKDIQQAFALSPQSLSNKKKRIRERILQNAPLVEKLRDLEGSAPIFPEGYVNRHDFLFSPSWGA